MKINDNVSNDSIYAKEFTCPVLVLDHHLAENEDFSPNMVVINNQISPQYHNKNLSGAGVVYQFCKGLDAHYNNDWAHDYIDLAAVGICGDMMSGLETENQYFWKEGFSHLSNYFLLTLARKQSYSITGKMSVTDKDIIDALDPMSVAFYMVPLINAMIRVGTQEEKERLFLAFIDGHQLIPSKKRGAKGTLEEVAVESVRECVNARSHQNKYKDDAVARLEQKIFKHDLLENEILFVRLDDEDDFPATLNGLVATQLSAKYHKPTIVARLNSEGYVRGSARGVSHSELNSLKDYLNNTHLFEYTQGHNNAFGISIRNKDLDQLHHLANYDLAQYDFGNSYYQANFERQALAADLEDIIYDIARYDHIWSQQCDEPLIYITDLHFNINDVQIIGKSKDTFKIQKNGITYIKFFAKDLIEEIQSHSEIKMEVVGKMNVNEWLGTYTPQIQIENYQIKEDSIYDF